MNVTSKALRNIPDPTLAQNYSSAVKALIAFEASFRAPFGYIALTVCVFGTIFNILNIIILSHKKMRNAVTLLLTLVSVSELMLLVIFIPYVCAFKLSAGSEDESVDNASSLHAARFVLFYANTSIFLHLTASWLIIITACFRFIFVQFPLKSVRFCSSKRAVPVAATCTVIACLLISIPNMMLNKVVKHPNSTTYGVRDPNPPIKNLNLIVYWLIAVFGKLLPTILLLIFTVFLVKILRKKRHHLVASIVIRNQARPSGNKQTSRMLLAIVMLFFIIEFPQGILLVYTSITDDQLTYYLLGDVIDLATLMAFSLNLALNTAMSKQYRDLFIRLFIKRRQETSDERTKGVYQRCNGSEHTRNSSNIIGLTVKRSVNMEHF